MQEIFAKQELLMDTVPHPLTPEASCMSRRAIQVIGSLILYINSLGRKPWRPEPLAEDISASYKVDFKVDVMELIHAIKEKQKYNPGEDVNRCMVSVLGIIEEVIECFNEVDTDSDAGNRPKILEEYVDILFFWAELGIENEFTWQEIKDEYNRKWAVNMKRYADAQKGDYKWDDRKDKKTL